MVAKSEANMYPFHRMSILSMDISADRKRIATGDKGKFP